MIGCFIISDSKPLIDEKPRINYSNDCTSEESVNHIVQKIRYGLFSANVHDRDTGRLISLAYDEDDDLRNKSYDLSLPVLLLCKKMGISAKIYDTNTLFCEDKINPNYLDYLNYLHYFTIAEINGEKYLIDCSYRQFFSIRNSSIWTGKPEVSQIMLADEKHTELARHLLKYGWIKATPENIKSYLDGFAEQREFSEEDYQSLLENANLKNPEWAINTDTIYSFIERYHGHRDYIKERTENVNSKFIIESTPLTDGLDEEVFDENWSDEQKLDAIVRRERLRISRMIEYGNDKPYDIENDSLACDCSFSACMIAEDCLEKNIPAQMIHTTDIEPMFGEYKHSKHLQHFFTIATLGQKKYLIDCTYRQFFTTRDNQEGSSNHYPGKCMIMDEERKKVAQTILKRGWIEATPQNLKSYADGFIEAHIKNGGKLSTDSIPKNYLTRLLGDGAIISYPEIVDFSGENPPDNANTLGTIISESEVEIGD